MPYHLENRPPKEGIHGLKDFIHQPIQTIKVKAGRKINKAIAKNLFIAEISYIYDIKLILTQDYIISI